MPINYDKMTVKKFTERLEVDTYKNITAARRAIGKVQSWSEADKKRAHLLANRHFDVEPGQVSSTRPSRATAPSLRKALAKTAAPASSPTFSSRLAVRDEPPAPPPTNAEVIQLCGVANELVETIRKSAELSIDARPVLLKGTEVLLSCLQLIAGALQAKLSAGRASALAREVKKLGTKVAPQGFISHGANEADEDARSAAGA